MDQYEQQKFIDGWEKKRGQGRLQFTLRQTAWYAALFATLGVLLDLFDTDFMTALNNRVLSWRILIYLVAGVLLAQLNWWMMERQYRKIKSGK